MNAGDRLVQIRGPGVAGCVAKSLAAGTTTSEALVNYSMLTGVSACRHLLASVEQIDQTGGGSRPPVRFIPFLPVPARRKRKRREEDLLFIQHH